MKALFRSTQIPKAENIPESLSVEGRFQRAPRLLLCTVIILALLIVGLLLRLHEEVFVPQAEERILYAREVALEQLGKPYVFAEAGPDNFDCSGLMCYAYGNAGVQLAHNTDAVAYDDSYETIAEPSDLRVGDLLFFDTVRSGDPIDHVGFWLGRNRFIHASSTKGAVVVSDFDELWQERFSWAKRVI